MAFSTSEPDPPFQQPLANDLKEDEHKSFVPPRPGPTTAQWWQRAVAIIIDAVILQVPKLVIAALIVGSGMTMAFYATGIGVMMLVLGLSFMVIDIAYFAFLNGSKKGQTIGQVLMGITVTDAVTGGPIDPPRAAKRILILAPVIVLGWIPFIGMIAGLYTIVAGLSPLWDPNGLGFHDKATNTRVIEKR